MYCYGANNPIKYTDPDGRSGELAEAAREVMQNPQQYGEFALLAVCSAMLIYACTPEGRENIAEFANAACESIVNTCTAIKCEIDERSEFATLAKTRVKELSKTQTKNDSTGYYVITFESEKTYCGKGGQKRAAKSAVRESVLNKDLPVSIDWKPSINDREAFKSEYMNIEDHRGPQNNPLGDYSNYNRIQSPGAIYYYLDNGHFYTPNSR